MPRKRRPRSPAIPRHVWDGVPMLKDARTLNERCFAQLAQAAKAHPEHARTPALRVLAEFAARTDARACARAGSCPVLLVSLNFDVPEHWERGAAGSPASPPSALFAPEVASPLAHEILMHAWTLARSAPRTARLFFGMAASVTQAIAQLTGAEIERIAHERAAQLRPRWEDRETFWKGLLDAATGTSEEALVDVHLHCLSLLGGELIPLRRVG
jgi:hypothetical protein